MTSRAWSNVPIGLAAFAVLVAAGPAGAQVQNETLRVQARIGEACTVTNATLDFGQSLDLDANTDANGSIEIDCQSETPLGVELDGGLTPSGTSNRNMLQGGAGAPILYTLFRDSQRSVVWGAGDQVAATINGSGSVPVYGRVPSQGNGHAAGLYSDEVTITLTF